MTEALRRTAEQAVHEAANIEARHRNQFWDVSDRMNKPVGRTLAGAENQHAAAMARDGLASASSDAWRRAGVALEALRSVDPKAAAEVQAMAARLVAIKKEDIDDRG